MAESRRRTTQAEEALLGQTVAGRYRVLKHIGSGGMGSVYVVEHLTTGRRMALKTLLPGLGSLADVVARFEREAKAASMLRHPNVVDVTDFGTLDDGTLFMVMEYVRGRSLGDVMDEGPMDAERALKIVRQVLDTLDVAHAAGLIHRDLKPDNVMLVDVGESDQERDLVKLLDFGIVRIVGEAEEKIGGGNLTQAGVAFGTPDYMAPEQALGDKVDGRADLYAVGVLLFEMVAGKKPFESEDRMALVRMHVGQKPPRLRDVAPAEALVTSEMEAVVEQAMAKRRGERYADAAAMNRAVEAALVSVRKATGRMSTRRLTQSLRHIAVTSSLRDAATWARRPRFVRRLVIGLPVLTLVVVLLLVWLRSNTRPTAAGIPSLPGLPAAQTDSRPVARQSAQARELVAAGHARFEAGHKVSALGAYERAMSLDPAVALDARVQDNVADLVADDDEDLALAALDLMARRLGAPAHPFVVEIATGSPSMALRHRALAIAEEKGIEAGVNRVTSYGLDLQQGDTCRRRLGAVMRLRELNNPLAIPLLEMAASKDDNACLVDEARAAIVELEGDAG